MCLEEVVHISTFLFAMTLVVGTMGIIFFKTWHKDRKKEGVIIA